MTMDPLDLAPIKARSRLLESVTYAASDAEYRRRLRNSAADVPLLVAEVERYRRMVEQLRVDLEGLAKGFEAAPMPLTAAAVRSLAGYVDLGGPV